MRGAKYIGYLTIGVRELVDQHPDLLAKLLDRFAVEVRRHEDWFYEVVIDGFTFFMADNGEDGYTAMLPSEY